MDSPAPIRLPGGRSIPEEALRFRADPAGGPGGQHANRSATRIELSVNVADLPLEEHERRLIEQRLASRISRDGVLSVSAGERRSQLRNKHAARERLQDLLAEALTPDKPRHATRPSRAARLRRRLSKEHRSKTKRERRYRPGDS